MVGLRSLSLKKLEVGRLMLMKVPSDPQGRASGDAGDHRGGKERQIGLNPETAEVPPGRDGV